MNLKCLVWDVILIIVIIITAVPKCCLNRSNQGQGPQQVVFVTQKSPKATPAGEPKFSQPTRGGNTHLPVFVPKKKWCGQQLLRPFSGDSGKIEWFMHFWDWGFVAGREDDLFGEVAVNHKGSRKWTWAVCVTRVSPCHLNWRSFLRKKTLEVCWNEVRLDAKKTNITPVWFSYDARWDCHFTSSKFWDHQIHGSCGRILKLFKKSPLRKDFFIPNPYITYVEIWSWF